MTVPSARARAAAPWIAYAAAWMPFAILELVSVFLQDESAGALRIADTALTRTAISASLGIGVWWLSGRIAFPDRGRMRFYALQLGLALVFATLWNVLWYLRAALTGGWASAIAAAGDTHWIGWQMMMGVWLYLLIAGVSYTLRVHRLMREKAVAAARSDALAARAQLAALRAQLNPHFLFNSLHSLTALVRHDAATAEEALGRLGSLLRYALDGSENDDVLLSEEWAFTRDYLALEALRLGPRLRLTTRVDPDALDREVPSFVLQPLVENAVRHGIAPRPEGGGLTIAISLKGDLVVMQVGDDGRGAAADALANGRGHGLRVLRQRLEARFGARARVEVVTAPGNGFAVTVTLPTDEPMPARVTVG